MIKAILFDVDGVLIDSFEANWQFFCNLMRAAGYKTPTRDQYRSMFHLPMIEVIKVLADNPSEVELARIKELTENREQLYPVDLVKSSAGAFEMLTQLQQKYQLGLVTSRVRAGVYSLPPLAKLESLFSVTVTYEDTAEHKPHPAPLLVAAKMLGVEPAATIYVGDAETDFQAAKAAGMKTIMYRNSDIKAADGYISSMSELPELLANLSL